MFLLIHLFQLCILYLFDRKVMCQGSQWLLFAHVGSGILVGLFTICCPALTVLIMQVSDFSPTPGWSLFLVFSIYVNLYSPWKHELLQAKGLRFKNMVTYGATLRLAIYGIDILDLLFCLVITLLSSILLCCFWSLGFPCRSVSY